MSTMRELKGRIGSVQSSQKITSAMKMISSAKLRKAEIALKHVVPFRDQIQSTINNLLGADSDYQSPLTEQRPVQRVAFVIFGSDEGLCGAFNVQLYKSLIDSIDILRESSDSTIEVTVYPIGKKVKSLVAKTPGIQVRPVEYLSSKSTPDTLKRFSDELTEAFLAHEFDRIEVVYAYYKSVASQVMKTRLLLPISTEEFLSDAKAHRNTPYIELVLPLFVRSTLQEACYQSRTSEQGARIMAMQMASDNAKNLLEDLQLEYNKLRQQGITTELLDILGGTVKDTE
ncbi:ATP synthase F1 subunit gamma [Coprobacter fastidiosus]|uniref:ATP synthase F1 subunit gamma n=1 Tax=Coprobacter fastidiosus TaxID=1099853 RepID=UPI0026658F21|nr:ATP synthase F1 subunit gamma [Coprobacter fastidiosus]